jgi:hypothetical protein
MADLVATVAEASGLSEAVVRSVLWQTRQAGWRVVRTEDTGMPSHKTVITEEWTP